MALMGALLGAATTASAADVQTSAAPGQYKIGIVNVKEVFDAYQKQKEEYKKLQTDRDTKQKDIDALSERVSKAKEKYEAEKTKMPEAERDALEEQIQADFSRYQAEFKRLQQDIDRREKKMLDDIFDAIHKAVQEVGAQGDYHLILEAGVGGRSGVLYSSPTLNMTTQIIDYVNSGAAKAPAAPAAPKPTAPAPKKSR